MKAGQAETVFKALFNVLMDVAAPAMSLFIERKTVFEFRIGNR